MNVSHMCQNHWKGLEKLVNLDNGNKKATSVDLQGNLYTNVKHVSELLGNSNAKPCLCH